MMRKHMAGTVGVVLVLATAAVVPASAQAAVGVRGGMRMASLTTTESSEGLDGLVLGGYFGFGLTDRMALQIETVYGARGSESVHIGADDLDPTVPSSRVSMRYLDVPVLLRTGFPGERFLPSFFVGPYVSFLLGCDLTPSGGSVRDCDAPGELERFAPRKTDYGVVAGGALDVAMGRNTVFVDLRYTLGLASIQAGSDAMDALGNTLEITAGLAFPLGR